MTAAGGLRIGLAQINPIVGDLDGNVALMRTAIERLRQKSDLILFPELSLCGYPPEDLVLRRGFVGACMERLRAFVTDYRDGPGIIIGSPWAEDERVYNAAFLVHQGKILGRVLKCDLPNYGVFDEKRTYASGPLPEALTFMGQKIGVMICEDLWTPAAATHLKKQGAAILLSPNGSPYEYAKHARRVAAAKARVAETGLPFVYVNQVGGYDDLIYDGQSFVLDGAGAMLVQARAFMEEFVASHEPFLSPTLAREADIYGAICLGIRDYAHKNNFKTVVLGLSGGIDSALVATLACDALGADCVRCVMLPSPYTSDASLEDAALIAKNLGCQYDVMVIDQHMKTLETQLTPAFGNKPRDVTEENMQSRLRGLILMALSNKFGHLLLATGNKSEFATGYATLYGDMCGGYAPLKDLYKGQVYALANWRNAQETIIPARVLTRAPSAELRPDQTDQDTLPPYETLDRILFELIEQGQEPDTLPVADQATGARVAALLRQSEYKRRQAPPGPKVSSCAFGKDWRMPLTARAPARRLQRP